MNFLRNFTHFEGQPNHEDWQRKIQEKTKLIRSYKPQTMPAMTKANAILDKKHD